MTRNTWPSAFICGSHICKVQPSELDSIRVGPPSRPSTETLSRQPSASIIGMETSPVYLDVLLVMERSEQAINQCLRNALIGHRLKQLCDPLRIEMGGDFRLALQHRAQAFLFRDGFLAGGLDQMMRL